jgi:hypothetical protein
MKKAYNYKQLKRSCFNEYKRGNMKKQRNRKTKSSDELLEKEKLERLELRLKILKLAFEIPLVTTALVVAIDKILKL